MKKIIAILLVVVLVIPMCIIPASAEYNGEIQFRNTPWGLNYEETIDSVTKDIRQNGGSVSWSELIPTNYNSIKILSQGNIGPASYQTIGRVYSKSLSLTVAGFKVEDIVLYFVYEFDGKNLLQDKEHTAFYMAQYEIKAVSGSQPTEERRIFETILKDLYGAPDEKEIEGLFPQFSSFYYSGNNDTQLILTEEQHLFNGSKIYINYLWREGDTIANSAYSSLYKLERENALSNARKDTGGL